MWRRVLVFYLVLVGLSRASSSEGWKLLDNFVPRSDFTWTIVGEKALAVGGRVSETTIDQVTEVGSQ
jgi:hypothetical protein